MSPGAKAIKMVRNAGKGADWEQVFYKQALLQGLLVRKVPPSCKIKWNGQLELVDGELDFQLIHRQHGITAFVDTKSFAGDSFNYSQLEPNQIELAKLYNECHIPAGFCVYFNTCNVVVFFTGEQIAAKGPRSSFKWDEGVFLGKLFDFALGTIFT